MIFSTDLLLTPLQLWEILFSTNYAKEVMTVEMNKELDITLTYGEFCAF